jgi:PIN domain nuclease of toxin-antitoxin system
MVERRTLQRVVDRAIHQKQPIVLDTSALLEFFSGASPIASLVSVILEDDAVPIVYSTVTISEVLVRPARLGNNDLVTSIKLGLEHRTNTRIVVFDGEQAIETARVRAATNLKLPDSAIIAAARTQHAIGIVGADRQWRGRELGVPFYYLPDMLEAERG